ncbi:protein PEP-RELATED DEVELOPMENT ARRESTED 1, chloroplastic-like [Bidens hawaiensis]|uniref:protein PEP-RELATED DEVELOPMENT ARRESTED 1, chloroplastic-like n=1 Tax=Bidens hawaiensis TaxID=980011 RepID=UPI00404AF9BF
MISITKPILSSTFLPPPLHSTTIQKPSSLSLQNKRISYTIRASYEVGGGYTQEELDARRTSRQQETTRDETSTWSPAQYEALLKGGEQVTSVLEEMANLLEDDQMDEESEELAVLLAAQGVIGKRVDQMESGFMMALDYMIQLAEKDEDERRKSLLEVIKETVLSHLTKKCPPHVQVVGLLCRTPQKESRHELLRRVAAGGGAFESEHGAKVHLPGANLNDIANQADDLLETMESRPVVPDRKLLARLVLIREEARSMMGGGLLDERNNRGLNTLPRSEVNFLTKLVAQKPGKQVRDMIKNVMLGKDEGADRTDEEQSKRRGSISSGIAGKGSKPNPVRPGMFLETVSKVLGGIYDGNISGITAQHLEWVHQNTLQVLQEIAF